MTEFDKELNNALHKHKRDSRETFYSIADSAGIKRSTLYRFASSDTPMNGENTNKLMNYLNLTINLEEKK